MSNRTNKVILTPEAHVLRCLRTRSGLSMRSAGEILECSDSYISQIENGRENPPQRVRLQKFLKAYGDISEKYYRQLCREWQDKKSDDDVICDLVTKLKPDQLKLIRAMVEQMVAGKI